MTCWAGSLLAFLLGLAIGAGVAGWLALLLVIRVFEAVERNDEAIWGVARGRSLARGGPEPANAEVARLTRAG